VSRVADTGKVPLFAACNANAFFRRTHTSSMTSFPEVEIKAVVTLFRRLCHKDVAQVLVSDGSLDLSLHRVVDSAATA